jgi:toxin ParE1/3/4
MKLLGYKLSIDADLDLEEIFDYTETKHNFNQAVTYLTDLENVFKNLVIHPEVGRQRNEIKMGLFSITEQKHVIFYRILENDLRILRVLHGSKDLPRNFK